MRFVIQMKLYRMGIGRAACERMWRFTKKVTTLTCVENMQILGENAQDGENIPDRANGVQ